MSNAFDLTTQQSEPDKVDVYTAKRDYPLKNVVQAVRKLILSTDREIGEEVRWNAPAFGGHLAMFRSLDDVQAKKDAMQ